MSSDEPAAHSFGSGVPDHAPTRNPARTALVVLGLVSGFLGAVLWGVGANQLAHDKMVGEFTRAIGLDNGLDLSAASPAIDADNALIWWGIALVILGVVLLVARLVIAAAGNREVAAG